MAAKQGPDFLFYMPNRTRCIIFASVMPVRGEWMVAAAAAEASPPVGCGIRRRRGIRLWSW
jgi:hypothetical protein